MQLVGVLCETRIKLLWLWLLRELEWTNPQAGISLLVLNCLFVTFPPLLLHNKLHFPLRMFYNGSGDLDHVGRETRCASEGVLA